jgi:hypothetical protein
LRNRAVTLERKMDEQKEAEEAEEKSGIETPGLPHEV